MYASSAFVFTAVVALAHIAAASPPTCLIEAISAQPDPSDFKALCGSLEPQVAGNITQKCSGDVKLSAISAYSSSCLASEAIPTVTATPKPKKRKRKVCADASGTATTTSSATTTPTTTVSTAGSTASSTSTNAASLPTSRSELILAPLALAVGWAGQYVL